MQLSISIDEFGEYKVAFVPDMPLGELVERCLANAPSGFRVWDFDECSGQLDDGTDLGLAEWIKLEARDPSWPSVFISQEYGVVCYGFAQRDGEDELDHTTTPTELSLTDMCICAKAIRTVLSA